MTRSDGLQLFELGESGRRLASEMFTNSFFGAPLGVKQIRHAVTYLPAWARDLHLLALNSWLFDQLVAQPPGSLEVPRLDTEAVDLERFIEAGLCLALNLASRYSEPCAIFDDPLYRNRSIENSQGTIFLPQTGGRVYQLSKSELTLENLDILFDACSTEWAGGGFLKESAQPHTEDIIYLSPAFDGGGIIVATTRPSETIMAETPQLLPGAAYGGTGSSA